MYMSVLPECMNVQTIHVLGCPKRADESVSFLGTGIRDGYEPPHGCWELNLGPVQVLSTTDPSFPALH